ncbi:MAG: uroporphyrinogen-III synthase [Burkholderiales bacterium]|jgi:uroporphyrinogen-III synthase|nr:uroporphyrinogen-III synthase [Burkholderiales bacterium]
METSPHADPAFHRRVILVTRPQPEGDGFANTLVGLGAIPLVVPAIEIAPPKHPDALAHARHRLGEFDFAMFVSANAVRFALGEPSRDAPMDRAWPSHVTALATGQGTRAALKAAGVPDTCIQTPIAGEDSEGLLALPLLSPMKGRRVVIFRGETGRALLGDALQERGATVEYVSAYRRICPVVTPDLRQTVSKAKLSASTFTATEALLNFEAMFDPETLTVLKQTPAFVPHQRIAQTATQLNWQTVVTSSGDHGLISGMRRYFIEQS